MTAQYFFVKYAKGQDGGFGDYRSPDWECAEYLKDDNGNLLWFSNGEEAGKFVQSCNDYSENVFYSHGDHYEYDGDFPVEYSVFSFAIPNTEPAVDADAAFAEYKEKVKEEALSW